jgi:transposase
MRFVPVKDVDQRAVLMTHRARNLLVRQRTMAVNALRAHLAGFGVVAPQGLRHVERLVAAIEENKAGLPELAQSILRLIAAQLEDTQAKVRQIEARLAQGRRNSRLSRLLATVPGVTVMGASAIASHGRRSKPVSVWARIRGLARHDAAPELLRRQGAAGASQRFGGELIGAFSPRRGEAQRGCSTRCRTDRDPRRDEMRPHRALRDLHLQGPAGREKTPFNPSKVQAVPSCSTAKAE